VCGPIFARIALDVACSTLQGGRWWIPPPCPLPTPEGGVESADEDEDEKEMAAMMRPRAPLRSEQRQESTSRFGDDSRSQRWPAASRYSDGRERRPPHQPKQRAGGGELAADDLSVSLHNGLYCTVVLASVGH
jgi:hypothetical protein